MDFFYLIVSSSATDKKLEIDKKLKNKLKNKLEIYKKISKKPRNL